MLNNSLSLSLFVFPTVQWLASSFSAHIYHSHYQTYRDLDLAQYLNMMTLHMVLFVEQFSLVEEKELTVLNDLIGALKQFKGNFLTITGKYLTFNI